MSIYRQGINTRIKALILSPEIGGYDAAAEIINTSRPKHSQKVHKGTFTKRFNKNLEWPTGDWMALEDAAGRYPVSRYISARRIQDASGDEATFSHLETMKEGHDAVMAQAMAETTNSPDVVLEAIEETQEVRDLADRDMKALQAKLQSLLKGGGII